MRLISHPIRRCRVALRAIRVLVTLSQFVRWTALSSAVLLILAAKTGHAQQTSPLEYARRAMEAKDYAKAETMYRRALAQDPLSPQLLTDLGLSLQLQGHSTYAMHYYSLALKRRYLPETYALLAQEMCKMGDRDDARPMLARIYRDEQTNLRVLAAVAPCYLDIDEPIESVSVYAALQNSSAYAPDLALIQLAKSYMRSGQSFAEKLSKTAGSEHFLTALRQASDSGPNGARSAFPEAALISSNFAPNLSWAEAVERWRQHPEDVALLYLLSVLSAEESMHQIEICQDRYPTSPYLQQYQADVLADQGSADEAAAAYEQLMKQYPELPDLGFSLGLLYEKHGEWEKAAVAYRQQLAHDARDERTAAHLSECMLQTKQYVELRDFLQPKMREEQPPQWVKVALAEAEEELGNVNAAVKLLVAAEQDPNPNKLVHYRLMHLYLVTGRREDAKRELALFKAASKR